MTMRVCVALLLTQLLPALCLDATMAATTDKDSTSPPDLEQQLSVFLEDLAEAVQLLRQQQAAQAKAMQNVQEHFAVMKVVIELADTVQHMGQQQAKAMQNVQEQLAVLTGISAARAAYDLDLKVEESSDVPRAIKAKRDKIQQDREANREANRKASDRVVIVILSILGVVLLIRGVCILREIHEESKEARQKAALVRTQVATPIAKPTPLPAVEQSKQE